MAYVLQKRGRFMTGHSYATGFGWSFTWSLDESKARRFADTDPSVDTFARRTGAKIVPRKNTRQELRALGKACARILAAGKSVPHPSDAKINRRAALAGRVL